MRFSMLVLAIGLLYGCSARQSSIAHQSAPDPTGCFVEVFEKEGFQGQRDFINGPAKHFRLKALPFGADWNDRIRSLRVGPAAQIAVWVDEGFAGESMRSGADRSHPRLRAGFNGEVSSLQITCG